MIKNVLNTAALLISMVGILFKGYAWAGASVIMLVGFTLLLVSALAFTLKDNNTAGTPPLLSYLMIATLVAGILGLVFKTMHWEGGSVLTITTGLLLVALSIALIASRTVTISRQFITVFVIWFALLVAWLNISYLKAPALPVVPESSTSPQ